MYTTSFRCRQQGDVRARHALADCLIGDRNTGPSHSAKVKNEATECQPSSTIDIPLFASEDAETTCAKHPASRYLPRPHLRVSLIPESYCQALDDCVGPSVHVLNVSNRSFDRKESRTRRVGYRILITRPPPPPPPPPPIQRCSVNWPGTWGGPEAVEGTAAADP